VSASIVYEYLDLFAHAAVGHLCRHMVAVFLHLSSFVILYEHTVYCILAKQAMHSTFYMMMRLLLVLVLLQVPLFTRAFPDHLQGRGGCLTELATDEVIMNAFVIAYQDSRDPDIQVVAIQTTTQDGGSSDELLQSPIVVTHVPVTFEMVVTNPNEVGAVQYVMDTSLGATFERGWCDEQKRVPGRPGDRHTLTIHSIPETPIQVWAGWAAGRQAVTLTNYFLFTSQTWSSDDTQPKAEVVEDEL
jgi:hypothetical protein